MDAGELKIRLATEADLATINGIYNFYVLNSTCTFQTEPDTAEEREKWFAAHDSLHPVTVAVNESEIVAWASLSRYHHRCAYQHTVEDSVYVCNDMRGRGIGTILLADLIQRAEAHGHHSIVAIIAADQTGSIRLQRFGFLEVGHIREPDTSLTDGWTWYSCRECSESLKTQTLSRPVRKAEFKQIKGLLQKRLRNAQRTPAIC